MDSRLFALFALVVACGGAPPPPSAPLTVPPPTRTDAPIATEPSLPASEAASESDVAVSVTAADPVWGNRRAPVTIVWFGDFQCPFTARSALTIRAVEEKYGPDAVRVIWKNEPLPFHAHAREAAEMGSIVRLIGGDDAFWAFHKLAFDNQANIATSIESWAEATGIEKASIEKMIAADAGAGKVDADHALGKAVGVIGTPAFFINGVSLSGAQPLEKFASVIDAEREKALAKIAAGTAADRVYAAMVAENFKAPSGVATTSQSDDGNSTAVFKVPVGSSPVRGRADALVTIIEFADFQCPYSKRVEATLSAVRAKYGDKIRFVWKDNPLPFHPRAEPASELAREARAEKGDGAFWTAHDALFASQPKLEDADLDAVAKLAGLDLARTRAAITTKRHHALIEGDEDLADSFSASGTPHFFINGRRLVGAQPEERFDKIIDAEIVRAQALVAKGVSGAALYDALIKDGAGAPEPEVRILAEPAGAPSKGTGPIVIQEFGDFQCPFTARAQASLTELEKSYPGKLRVVWRNLPLTMHPLAAVAAEAALEAKRQKGDSAFWKMLDKLFGGQKIQDGLERPALEGYARDIGLDVAKFNDALDQRVHKSAVDLDVKAANAAGISATPAFTVGGYLISGAQPVARFRHLVDRVLANGPAKASAPSAHAVTAAATPAANAKTLGIVDTTVGTGQAAKNGDTLTVHYVGRLTDGTEFDSSRTRGVPFTFPLGGGRVIKGWDQGLVGMRVGGRRTLTIPAALGYGDRGAPPKIPAGATLIFDVELLSIP